MEPLASEATQAVQVALNIRPLITSERIQGCKDCICVVPGEPQVQIGAHSFTFDHVFGSCGTPLSALFSECVAPLVDGLFHGYNATVLAYGQTGSGKTFTMGTGYTVGGSTDGVIPQVMTALFSTVESLKEKAEIILRVSYIEILKEEIHDLLDPSPPTAAKPELANGGGMFGGVLKLSGPAKTPIQIRETTNGGITIAGITETVVNNISEMAGCLEQGSLCRATGSTNMNSSSSRSHAIFTVILEQRRKWDSPAAPHSDDLHDDFLCAKLHLVDLAGSERVKRTGADGLRFKEGVHINRGLLALGNVISALGDEKKRKEGGHVPYRDSKLTRLLQDSLGGNSRTVMIACVSPADSNAEETLNTLKYANRARNIQNKPTVNRDPVAAELQRMRQQMGLMQAELQCARAGGSVAEDVQMLKERITWLETSNTELQRDLETSNGSCSILSQRVLDAQVERDILQMKLLKVQTGKPLTDSDEELEGLDILQKYLKRIQVLENALEQAQSAASQPVYTSGTVNEGQDNFLTLNGSFPEEARSTSTTDEEFNARAGVGEAYAEAKELEHTLLQDRLDKELQELNKLEEQKEAEMKSFTKSDGTVLKNHFEKKLVELEDEKKLLQKERDALVNEIETLTNNSDESAQKMQETYQQKLKMLESQISELKKKQENHSQLLRQKQRSEEAAKRLSEEIHRIKTQKVQLQQKIKQEAEQFRHWKTSREKEVLQLRKEGRRTEYEMHKLQALNQRQKMVLQRKTEEAAIATRRLKELLEARKPSLRDNISQGGSVSNSFSSQWLEQELEVAVRVHEVRSAYEKQAESRVTFAAELRRLQEEEEAAYQQSPIATVNKGDGNSASIPDSLLPLPTGQAPMMSPNARKARIGVLENLVDTSSTALVSMASQLSEAEERQRMYTGVARWQHIRTLGDAKNLLQLIFNAAAFSRCQLRDKDEELRELKEKMAEMEQRLRKGASRNDIERRQRVKENPVNGASAAKVFAESGAIPFSDELAYQSRIDVKNGFMKNFADCAIYEPIALRKASRGLQSSKIAPYFESDDLERESDMDISDGGVSDEDWEDRSTRCTVKKSREGADRSRIRKAGKMSQVNRMSRVGCKPVLQDQEAYQSQHTACRVRPPAGEIASEGSESQSRPGTEGCCSCSPCSGCKTRKCECKAAGGLCGPNCGCKASKCANRETLEVEADPSAVATANQMEVAEAVAYFGVAKERGRVNDEGDSVEGGSSKLEGAWVADASTMRAQQVLAFHGATVLDNAWRESLQEEQLQSAPETSDGFERDIPAKRKPLGDIGNKKVKPQGRTLFKPRRRALRGSMPAEAPGRVDFASDTAAAIANSALIAATGSSTPAGGSACAKGEETRKDAPSPKVEEGAIMGLGIPTISRPFAACENLVAAGNPNFVEHDVVKSSSSTITRSSTDVDKENRNVERKGHS